MKKKIFIAVLVVMSTLMLSGCYVYVQPVPEYTLTVCNKSDYKIIGLYVVNLETERIYEADDAKVYRYSETNVRHLPNGTYRAYFRFSNEINPQYTEDFVMNTNRTILVHNDYDSFYSIVTDDLESTTNQMIEYIEK